MLFVSPFGSKKLKFAATGIRNRETRMRDLRYYHYRAPTFGLGTNSPDSDQNIGGWLWQVSDTKDTEGSYPMSYNYVKFHKCSILK